MSHRVLFVCGAGVSTSIVVKLMENMNEDERFQFNCCDMNSAPIHVLESDLVMLAPHVRFALPKLEKICQRYDIPILVLTSQEYAKIDPEKLQARCAAALALPEPKTFRITLAYDGVGYHAFKISDGIKRIESEDVIWNVQVESITLLVPSRERDLLVVMPESRFRYKHLLLQHQQVGTQVVILPMKMIQSMDLNQIRRFIQLELENMK